MRLVTTKKYCFITYSDKRKCLCLVEKSGLIITPLIWNLNSIKTNEYYYSNFSEEFNYFKINKGTFFIKENRLNASDLSVTLYKD